MKKILNTSLFKVILRPKTNNTSPKILPWVINKKDNKDGPEFIPKNKKRITKVTLINTKLNSDNLLSRMTGFNSKLSIKEISIKHPKYQLIHFKY
jgi:hypothetical protein